MLPAGALKQQLLTEIADLVQLSPRELTDIWHPAPAKVKRERSAGYAKDGPSRQDYPEYSPRTQPKEGA